MKTRDLARVFTEMALANPDDDVCILWWTKPDYDYADDDEVTLTDGAWAEIVAEFEQWETRGVQISEWIADAVVEKAEDKL